jgi:hypothetical protein
MKTLALATLFVFAASVASAQSKQADATVFGLHLGEKFTVPECARSKAGDGYDYGTEPAAPCFRQNIYLPLPPPNTPVLNDQHLKIYFPPTMLSDLTLDFDAEVVDGNLEGAFINTDGLDSQDKILATLVAKYGVPSTLVEERGQNAMGAIFNSHMATWQFGNLTVVFCGTANRTDEGLVSIETEKETALRKAWREAAHTAEPKL